MSEKKAYLGDSVYVDVEHGMLRLTTDNGLGLPNNVIYLENDVYEALVAYVARLIAKDEQDSDEVVSDIALPCLNCGKKLRFALDSPEANGVFNVFCDGECEDRYAAKL